MSEVGADSFVSIAEAKWNGISNHHVLFEYDIAMINSRCKGKLNKQEISRFWQNQRLQLKVMMTSFQSDWQTSIFL